MMKLKELKTLFEHGVITDFKAVSEPMGVGFVLMVGTSGGGSEVLETATGERRVFSAIASCLKTARDIGAHRVTVELA